ncbi:ImmA/IrrE family metallo-endopeptidase [Roseovarius sp. A21]|uniref:ImmA/IrrE family metallo-endopeptidase n=1 Tax=Roseovarius bejariae TaxID=2576383 RepID=A0A844CM10_9RHOB|nr:ImmA/IrrE family metallo-endopeptidase [Roseovarius bejariae]MRU15817.1 ImmA/IrrE family metallo-endopeptidase [Roseovarius bejariae]
MTIQVNPAVLIWARETAGFALDEAASKLFKDGVKATAAENLAAMEEGEKQPTRTQLAKFAKLYKRPLLAFYMAEPPRTGQRGQDFRQTPDDRTKRENAMLDALLRDVKARQEAVRDLLLDDEDFWEHKFVGSMTIDTPVTTVASSLSMALGFEHRDKSLRRGEPDKLFRTLRAAAEDIGIFVLLLSDLGSYHSTIPSSVFRGFAIADEIAPFVVINAKEAKTSRSFTLMHELAHIWLGATGVSGQAYTGNPSNQAAKIEQFCNDVAGEFLLPTEYFKADAVEFDPDDTDAAEKIIDAISYSWSVSGPMVAYKLYRMGDLTSNAYSTLRNVYHARWQAALSAQKSKQKDGEGPSRNVVLAHNLGDALLGIVSRSVRTNALTYTKAARLLGSKANSVETLVRSYEAKMNKSDLFNGAS